MAQDRTKWPLLETTAGAHKLLRGKQRVHRAGAETLEVEGDKFESELLENLGELSRHRRSEGAGHFFTRDLDANHVSVMTHPELAEAEGTNRVFATLNDRK